MRNGFIVYTDGTKKWYKNDILHREGGPAVIRPDGMESWYKNGRRHRENGPAVVCADGTKGWYKEGVQIGELVETCLSNDKNVNKCCKKLEIDIKPTKYLTGQIVI